ARDTHYHFLVYNLDGEFLWEIPLPTLGTGWIIPVEQDDPNCYLEFQSFFYPMAIFKVNIETKQIEKVYQTKIPNFNPDDYELRFDFYNSKDGTKIPIYIIHRKGIERDGNNPTFLTGYGGFEISMNPHFSRSIIPWLKRGGIYAEAGIRGGGEYGTKWHKAGMLGNKQNVFDDFIYAGKFLISEKYTNPKKLAIYGGSNGGLLMGAVLTQAPEAFGAVACAVPLLDMIRFHKFGVAHIWTSEYGNPDREDNFEYLYKYSPYHNIDPDKKYPPTLFRTAEFDGRVHPMHAMKMAAAMQSLENQSGEFLLYVESRAGHGAGAPIYKYVEYYTDVLGFLGDKVGLFKNYGKL
ncbi:S9 family peptidase, partial [bacterium]